MAATGAPSSVLKATAMTMRADSGAFGHYLDNALVTGLGDLME